ncbi:MAG TPA: ribosome maturation factor RimM [Actinomycetota bacterium]|nr:ribosome maturation factor RimM [Actinomycetota bacterium]
MSSPEPPVPWVAVGRITRAHGIRGEVKVLPLTDVEERFTPASRLFLGESQERPLTVAASRPDRGRLLVRFEEIPDRTTAEALTGAYLFVPADSSPPLPEGEFWPHQLIGAEVLTESGRPLGTLREVVHTNANDVWITRDDGGAESLVPALRDVIVSVDTDARLVVVREVPGLTAPEED